MKVDYTLTFTSPIYDVLKKTNMNIVSLYLVYEMWDSMIKNARKVIYQSERKTKIEHSSFYEVLNSILIDY